MALELWETLKEAILVYTGLSPATFFTVLALFLAVYYVISGLFGSSDQYQRPREFQDESQPLPPPVQVGEVTEEELKQYDGSDPKKPLLMAIKGQIYDVSQSRYCVWIFSCEFLGRSNLLIFLGFLRFFRGKCEFNHLGSYN
jgi:membrane-associated progesterone receptor component